METKDPTKAVNSITSKLRQWEATLPHVSLQIIGLPEYVEIGLQEAGLSVVRDEAGHAHVASRLRAAMVGAGKLEHYAREK